MLIATVLKFIVIEPETVLFMKLVTAFIVMSPSITLSVKLVAILTSTVFLIVLFMKLDLPLMSISERTLPVKLLLLPLQVNLPLTELFSNNTLEPVIDTVVLIVLLSTTEYDPETVNLLTVLLNAVALAANVKVPPIVKLLTSTPSALTVMPMPFKTAPSPTISTSLSIVTTLTKSENSPWNIN